MKKCGLSKTYMATLEEANQSQSLVLYILKIIEKL